MVIEINSVLNADVHIASLIALKALTVASNIFVITLRFNVLVITSLMD